MDDLKKTLRREALQVRNALSVEERESASQKITELFLQTESYQNCGQLLLYASYGSEVDTYGILEQALSDGKQVFFPQVVKDILVFFQVEDKAALLPGYKGILEPLDGILWNPEDAPHSLLIYPGVAFDKAHNRLGYGKGFYDRFTSWCKEKGQIPENLALAYTCQIFPEIPAGEQDEKPDRILTESGIL